MFALSDDILYRYAPILSVNIAEMTALQELPDKSKDILLPIIPLKGWVGSHKLEKTIERVKKSFDDRYWIADIDSSFLREGEKKKGLTGEYPRDVFYEIEELLDPTDGYTNWISFVEKNEYVIPVVQLADKSQLDTQMEQLYDLGRGIVLRFTMEEIDTGYYFDALKTAVALDIEDLLVIYDYGQVSREVLTFTTIISALIKETNELIQGALVSISCSSFPSGFSGYNSSENSIYERILFNSVSRDCGSIRMIYSDRGSARADRIGGGGGIPSPRIDYPLPNDWRFIRQEFKDYTNPYKGEKEILYTKIAEEIMAEDYWNPELHVWGTQIIEFTSKGDEFGINSPMKATAVRINIHLHQQLYYDSPIELTNTDEDWED